MRDRRRPRRARAWRGHGRRRDRRHRGDHQRVHRVGLFRSEAHGAHRPAAQHPVGCALQVRARRRSRFRRAGARACDRAHPRVLRRRSRQGRDRRQGAEAERALQVRSWPHRAVERARPRHQRDQAAARSPRGRARRQGQADQGGAALLAAGHHSSGRSRRRGGAPDGRGQCAGHADAARGGRGKACADRGAEAAEADPARARGARTGRGGDLVVHCSGARQAVRRRRAGACAEQSDLVGACGDAPFSAAGADHRGAAEPRPWLRRRRPVRARPGLSRRASPRTSSSRRRACASGARR